MIILSSVELLLEAIATLIRATADDTRSAVTNESGQVVRARAALHQVRLLCHASVIDGPSPC